MGYAQFKYGFAFLPQSEAVRGIPAHFFVEGDRRNNSRKFFFSEYNNGIVTKMILKITLDSSLDENQYKEQAVNSQILFCTVKSVTISDLSTRFILDSAHPSVDELDIPFYTSVTIYGRGENRFFADYEGPPDRVNYIDVPCNLEEVSSFPGVEGHD